MNLDKESLVILRYIYKRKTVTYGQLKLHFPKKPVFDLISTLASEKAIDWESVQGQTSDGRYGRFLYDEAKISCLASGKKYVEDNLEHKKEKRKDAIRYAINTLISIAAIIISLISLLSQLGLIQLPQLTAPQESSNSGRHLVQYHSS